MGFLDAFNNSLHGDNHASPFGEAGLLGDPLHYIGGKKYDKFMRKTFELPNKALSDPLKKFDKFDRKINPIHRAIDRTKIGGKIAEFVHNKPADSAGVILGSIFGGGALLGGGGGGGSNLGIFANNGAGGMGGVGGGNAGALAADGGIEGGAGMGTAGTGAGAGEVGFSKDPQSYMNVAKSMGGNGQQQQTPKNTWLEDELKRQQDERDARQQIAQELAKAGYSPNTSYPVYA